jgi:hypothetical protein
VHVLEVLPLTRPTFPCPVLSPETPTRPCDPTGAATASLIVPLLLATLAAHRRQSASATSWQGIDHPAVISTPGLLFPSHSHLLPLR